MLHRDIVDVRYPDSIRYHSANQGILMPPFRLQLRCLGCKYVRSGWYPRILTLGDKHAMDTGHEMDVLDQGKPWGKISVPQPAKDF